jgi:hypothetical protein
MPVKKVALLLLFALAAPAAQRPAASLAEAEAAVLEAWDGTDGRGPLPEPAVAKRDRAGLRWLLAVARGQRENPFPPGSAGWKEAEAVRALPAARDRARAIRACPQTYAGSSLALWLWGRAGRFRRAERILWEDRLLEVTVPGVLRTRALQHALCFALAEDDEARFADLRREWGEDSPEEFMAFQRAFCLLGATSPVFRLWQVPGGSFMEGGLQNLQARHVLILPLQGAALPAVPADTAWIIPLLENRRAGLPGTLDDETGRRLAELGARLGGASRMAWFAPGEEPFGTYGLTMFPARLDLDPQGRITAIRMGDAAGPD